MNLSLDSTPVILCGEVLFDVFLGDQEVLGGATFNVAWNLRGLGLEPRLVSRVGKDERGLKILDAMRRWGLDTSGIQVDPRHPTGVVEVHLEEDDHRFQIIPDVAYDFLEAGPALEVLRGLPPSIFYHGTLILRAETARKGVRHLVRELEPAGTFVDLNLRVPWYTDETLDICLRQARWLKLSGDELLHVDAFGPDSPVGLEQRIRDLRPTHDLEGVLVTRGPEETLYLDARDQLHRAPAAMVDSLTDTVGAGDAFSSVFILGLLSGWPVSDTLVRASEFAGAVCGLRGAVSEDPEFYRQWRERWSS